MDDVMRDNELLRQTVLVLERNLKERQLAEIEREKQKTDAYLDDVKGTAEWRAAMRQDMEAGQAWRAAMLEHARRQTEAQESLARSAAALEAKRGGL